MENMAYTLYGLLEHGRREEALTLAEKVATDLVRCGFFSEEYKWDEETKRTLPGGVKPSVFGASLLIHILLLLNGENHDLPLV